MDRSALSSLLVLFIVGILFDFHGHSAFIVLVHNQLGIFSLCGVNSKLTCFLDYLGRLT